MIRLDYNAVYISSYNNNNKPLFKIRKRENKRKSSIIEIRTWKTSEINTTKNKRIILI